MLCRENTQCYMDRPKLKLQLRIPDIVLELIAFLATLAQVALPVSFYDLLPDEIPRHYNAFGEPDAWAGKAIIWTLPAIGLFLYISLTILNRYPHIFNYPAKVTSENAARMYFSATRLIRALKAIVACSFAYICYSTILTALDRKDGLGDYFTVFFVGGIGLVLVYYVIIIVKRGRKDAA